MVSDYELIGKGKGYAQIVYEDDNFVAFIQEKPIVPGQVTIIPRVKYTILEMLPSNLLPALSMVVNKVSQSVFETLKCHGTNVIIENGVAAGQDQPVMSVHVVPRFTEDGVPLEWEPKQLEEFDMDDAMSQLSSGKLTLGDDVVKDGPEQTKEEPEDQVVIVEDGGKSEEGRGVKEEKKEVKKKPKPQEEENYLIRSLRKIP